MTQTPGDQLEQIHNALVGAFDEPALRVMLRFKLDKHLHRLVKSSAFENMVFELLDVAEAEGWLDDLLRRAREYRPGNRGLQCEAITRRVGAEAAALTSFHSTIPNNLPRLEPFFGRDKELDLIREALVPESRVWGALIDGPGGMGKTSLAVRAAYECPTHLFERIIFVSLKDRELEDDGERELGNLLVPGFLEMLNEIARVLGSKNVAQSSPDQRVRLVLDALEPVRALLILDNLESLPKSDRDQLLTFVKRLPQGCKAILTSRRRIGSGSEELILEQLDQEAALATLTNLARRNKLLARTTDAERIKLYTQTGGKPLLLRWLAGQLGRGKCRTFADALEFLGTCPKGNDPLEFVFGDLATEFTPDEERALVALTYFAFPAMVEHIAAVAGLDEEAIEGALAAMSNRSLVVPSQEETEYALVPLVAEFLRKHRPGVVRETGARLEERACVLIVENGYQQHERFPALAVAWPTVAPALPLFLAGPNPQLQTICDALITFLYFTGRWDEQIALSRQAESRAAAAGDHFNAGWRAYNAGWVHYLREEADAVLACADRAQTHFDTAHAEPEDRAYTLRLRGIGHELKGGYPTALGTYREALELFRSVSAECGGVAIVLNHIARIERRNGELAAAWQSLFEALCISRAVGFDEGVALYTNNLAELALDRGDVPTAERWAREALPLAEKLGRKDLCAAAAHNLAAALVRQAKLTEARLHAKSAVDIFTALRDPRLPQAEATLRACGATLDT